MVKNDIDQLQSFGAKIKQQNKSISSPKHPTIIQRKISYTARISNFFKKQFVRYKHKIIHLLRKINIKILAFLSPYLIKIQTDHHLSKRSNYKKAVCRNQLIEKRKKIGNTVIVIRRRKKISSMKNSVFASEFQHVYYFHRKTQKKDMFQPKKSIWDVPTKYDNE
jgi:hypothetical protein